MKLIDLHDHVLQEIKVEDISGKSTTFKLGFKYLPLKQRKRLKQVILKNAYDTYKLQTILISNIVRVEDVVMLDETLTSSIELDIIGDMVRSNPYFSQLLEAYILFLELDFDITDFKKQNLYDLGKYQVDIDYDLIQKESDKQKEVLEKYGSLIAFPEQPKKSKEIDYQILFSSNKDIFNIFLSLRRWTGEFEQVNMPLLIQLSLEHGYKVKDIIDYLSIIYSSYNEHKPKDSQ